MKAVVHIRSLKLELGRICGKCGFKLGMKQQDDSNEDAKVTCEKETQTDEHTH